VTPDGLTERGDHATLHEYHDDQPVRFTTHTARSLSSIPYPRKLRDVPMIVAGQIGGRSFPWMLMDNFEELCLHPYLPRGLNDRAGVWKHEPVALHAVD
jgi:hypothetical protein